MSPATSSARSMPATRLLSSSPPWPARPTSLSAGHVKPRPCTTRANTTRWSPPASRLSSGLLSICLQAIGVDARSWQGWQIPIRTNNAHGAARIESIEADTLIERLGIGQVAVISGFQGLGPDNRIATLGRGGSDTSAVAIAAAIDADRCDIYTDVDGVYTSDPQDRTQGPASGAYFVRGNAGNGLARRQGIAGQIG